MATRTARAIQRAEAINRITLAASGLAGACNVPLPEIPTSHREPDYLATLQLDATGEFIEALAEHVRQTEQPDEPVLLDLGTAQLALGEALGIADMPAIVGFGGRIDPVALTELLQLAAEAALVLRVVADVEQAIADAKADPDASVDTPSTDEEPVEDVSIPATDEEPAEPVELDGADAEPVAEDAQAPAKTRKSKKAD